MFLSRSLISLLLLYLSILTMNYATKINAALSTELGSSCTATKPTLFKRQQGFTNWVLGKDNYRFRHCRWSSKQCKMTTANIRQIQCWSRELLLSICDRYNETTGTSHTANRDDWRWYRAAPAQGPSLLIPDQWICCEILAAICEQNQLSLLLGGTIFSPRRRRSFW